MGGRFITYPEYISFVKKVCDEFEVAAEDWNHLCSQIGGPEIDYTDHGDTNYTLKVGDEYAIDWESKVGKVFEMIGPNMRNKTTTLVYTATLLGLDWDTVEPYLDDKKIIKQANFIQDRLSAGLVTAMLNIENNMYKLTIQVEGGLASAVLWRRSDHERLLAVENLALTSWEDWQEYRGKLQGLFDVQFVAKGRNFISQVGFEEATNLAAFCRFTAQTISHYNKMLLSRAPKYYPETVNEQIDDLKRRQKGLFAQKQRLKTEITKSKAELVQLTDSIAELDSLLAQHTIIDYLELKSRLEKIVDLVEKKRQLGDTLKQSSISIANIHASLNANRKLVKELDNILDNLATDFAIIEDDLVLPAETIDAIAGAIEQKDVDHLIDVMPFIKVTGNTVEAHKALGEFSPSQVSLKTKLIGITIFDSNIVNLKQFRDKMLEVCKTATALAGISGLLDTIIDILSKLQVSEVGDYKRTINSIEDVTHLIGQEEEALKVNKNKYLGFQERIQELLSPYNDLDEMKAAYKELLIRLPPDKLARVNEIVYSCPGATETSVLGILKEQAENVETRITEISEKHDDIGRQVHQIKFELEEKEQELDNCIEKDDIQLRISSLREVSLLLTNVNEYFINKKLAFERRNINRIDSEGYFRESENNRLNLGHYFDSIIDLVNRRIHGRCPFAFINIGGVSRRSVEFFDFLGEDFAVDGLPEGAKRHGGITSSMTVYGLATKKSGSKIGAVLLVDEWGDVGVYKQHVFEALRKIPQLAFGIFVDVDENYENTVFEVR